MKVWPMAASSGATEAPAAAVASRTPCFSNVILQQIRQPSNDALALTAAGHHIHGAAPSERWLKPNRWHCDVAIASCALATQQDGKETQGSGLQPGPAAAPEFVDVVRLVDDLPPIVGIHTRRHNALIDDVRPCSVDDSASKMNVVEASVLIVVHMRRHNALVDDVGACRDA